MTREEAAHWVNAQRNALLIAVRDQNSPLGRALSERLGRGEHDLRVAVMGDCLPRLC